MATKQLTKREHIRIFMTPYSLSDHNVDEILAIHDSCGISLVSLSSIIKNTASHHLVAGRVFEKIQMAIELTKNTMQIIQKEDSFAKNIMPDTQPEYKEKVPMSPEEIIEVYTYFYNKHLMK